MAPVGVCGDQIGLQKPIYRRKDWDNVYHCAGKDTILAPSPLPQSFTPSYYATLQQLSYGTPLCMAFAMITIA